MSTDPTVPQDAEQRRRARKMSLQESRPPTEVPGYEPEQFLGVGAYGEVWVAVEKNTGRRVAIKFYAHRGGLDWSLLSREVEKLGMRTLAYHEAIPGHHLQIALSIEMEGVPFFRRIIPFTAFVEGWALYAERLAAEEGFHPTRFDRLGQLKAENFRAARLVVDTGIHAKRWTREQAIDYMIRNTATPETDAVAEVERYIVTL